MQSATESLPESHWKGVKSAQSAERPPPREAKELEEAPGVSVPLRRHVQVPGSLKSELTTATPRLG